LVGELPDPAVGAAQDQSLEALVLVQMNVQGRGYQVQGLMLGLGELAAQVWNVMIVYERNACYCLRRFVSKHFLGECSAGEVAKCFRPCCVALSLDQLIEFHEEIFLHRDAESFDQGRFFHCYSICLRWRTD